jgi:alpha-1,2-mannosyltransferase
MVSVSFAARHSGFDDDATGTGSRARSRDVRVWLMGIGVLSLIAWLVFVRPITPLDFDVFLAGGRAVAHGQSPYPVLGSSQVWSGSAFVYPWLTAWLFVPATAISAHLAALLMTAVSAFAVAAGVWALAGPRLVPFACVLFASPTIDGLQMGTLNALLFLGVCLAWRWRDHPARVGVTIGVLVTLKILCWPLAVWLLLTRRWGATTWAAGTGMVLLGIGWVFGPLGPLSYAQLLSQLSAHETDSSSGLQGMLVRWSVPVTVAELIGLACAAVLMALVARRSDTMIYAAAIVAALVASPVVWHHYYLLAAAPLLLARNGAWWYFLVGWASVPARESYGLSWHLVTVLASVGLAGTVAAMLWVRREVLVAALQRARIERLMSWLALLAVGLIVLGATVDVDVVVRGLAPAFIPVGASFAMLAVAGVRTAPARLGGPVG